MGTNQKRRIAVLAGSSLGWREKVMHGIASYAHEHGPWHVYTAPEGAEDSLFFTARYQWDGLIVRSTSGQQAKRIRALRVPTVTVGSVRFPGPPLPRVKVDDEKLARIALDHLLALGLRQFAYCGLFSVKAKEDRAPAFLRRVAEEGFPCACYNEFTRLDPHATWQSRERDLARWVRRLPKPVGILAWNPDHAIQVVEACNWGGIAVPDDVAVLAGDNDKMKCELSSPTVSAVEVPSERIGFEAAALLDRLMSGAAPPPAPVQVEPPGIVVVRESTDTTNLPDRDVRRAVQFMQDRASEPIDVPEIAASICVSRRWLERHFRRVLGRSPRAELLRTRLELAKKLLLETSWTTDRVAHAAGLTSGSYLGQVFRRYTGGTPHQFRQRFRLP
jgi:LacI family transcriptional regulator